MDLARAIVLGIVQGLTEFLPVSSSGHLVLADYYLFGGAALPLWVDIASNTGTFLAALLLMRREIVQALSGFFAGLVRREAREREGWKLALLILLASFPALVVGLAIKDVFESINNPYFVSFGLALTGLILWTAPRGGPKDTPARVSYRDAFLGGLAQSLAILPGVSRSGSTITAFLHLGLSPVLAAKLSFLMYAVASFGVMLLGLKDGLPQGVEAGPLLAMIAAAFASGYLAMLWLFGVLKRGQFRWFAPYVWALAALTLLTLR
ncbi:MAG TPA: undecaprenyl-diphosphate phosphatase [Oceanithermus profundus]|uniref:Undecaprenyl-diphosphatase n=1 Tax=Oceanithermus profundus TaxID=187137 RepID=A0A7C4VCZ9_9DEIN|nr:undecaprenyl-diphosphate phosphatase [Oceanithermus profundus]